MSRHFSKKDLLGETAVRDFSLGSALDELHRANRAQEEDGGDHEGVDRQPTEGEDGISHLR